MTTFVGLLRGINVGGNRTVRMADLRAIVEGAGGSDVRTYIQSGNVVFSHRSGAKALVPKLEKAIRAETGFDVPVVLRTAAEMASVIDRNPFPDADPNHLHVAFCEARPVASAYSAVDADAIAPEAFTLVGRELYLHLPNGMGRAKLPVALGRVEGPPATVRNWRTVTKLRDMAAG